MNEARYEQMLETLVEEKQAHEQRLANIRRELVDAERRDQRLEAAVTAVRLLLPTPPFVPAAPRDPLASLNEALRRMPVRSAEPVLVTSGPPPLRVSIEADTPRRAPSTDWVTSVVLDSGRPMRRDEVLTAVTERYGVPDSWTDPQASIGVALQRASARGALSRTGRGLYAPPDWIDSDSDSETEEVAIAQ